MTNRQKHTHTLTCDIVFVANKILLAAKSIFAALYVGGGGVRECVKLCVCVCMFVCCTCRARIIVFLLVKCAVARLSLVIDGINKSSRKCPRTEMEKKNKNRYLFWWIHIDAEKLVPAHTRSMATRSDFYFIC